MKHWLLLSVVLSVCLIPDSSSQRAGEEKKKGDPSNHQPSPQRDGEKPLVVELWPEKVPGETRDLGPEKVLEQRPNERQVKRLTNISKPTLTVFRPARHRDTGSAVVICPGGGYNILAWDLEGEEVAQWLNSAGITGIVLKYRVPRRAGQPRDRAPLGALQDAQRAIRLVRGKAREWGINPGKIGMLGFSAGGHLTAWTATNFDKRVYTPVDEIDRLSCRPDFTVLIYPAYLVENDGVTLRPDIRIGRGIYFRDSPLTVITSSIPAVLKAPPMFFAHAGDDPIKADNSIAAYQALKKAGVSAELHVYSAGGHGFGLRASTHPCSTWPRRCEEWLKAQGILRGSASGE